MSAHPTWSRRRFVASSAGAFGSGWLALNWSSIVRAAEHAHALAVTTDDDADGFEYLGSAGARDVAALAALIIPTTTTAGAHEAGVVYFIDRALGTFFAGQAPSFAAGLEALSAEVRAVHGHDARFAELDADQQEALARELAATSFFETVRLLTILGFLTAPSYGGNRGQLGWKAVGFTDAHAFAPPFGHYDRDYPGFSPSASVDEDDAQ